MFYLEQFCKKWLLIILISFLFHSLAMASDWHIEEDTGKILNKIETAYKELETYHDKGKVFTSDSYMEFETFFKYRDRFYFEWIEFSRVSNSKIHSMLCANSDDIYSYIYSKKLKLNEKEKHKSLRKAIGRKLGVSEGVLLIVPGLLIADLGFCPITQLEKPKLIGEESISGDRCYLLTTEHNETKTVYHLWVSKKNSMIKKVKMVIPEGEVTYIFETIDKNIVIQDSIFRKCNDK